MKNIFKNLVQLTVSLYAISVFVMTPIYNYQYATKHGMVKWVFFGEFIATAYAIAWPYYYFNPPLINTDNSYSNFRKSTDYYTEAVKKFNEFVSSQNQTDEKLEEIIQLYKKAVEYGEKVNIEVLNRRYETLGNRFQDEFIAIIRLQIKYLKDPNTTYELMMTTKIINDFWDWLWTTDEIWEKNSNNS